MIGLKAYQMHQAFNLHFTSDYDYFKYGGKTRSNEDSFKKNQFRWQYASLEKKYDNLFFLFYLTYKEAGFQYIRPQQLFKLIHSRIVSKRSLDETYKNILVDCKKSLETILSTSSNMSELYPKEYQLYLDKKVSFETIILYDHYIKKVFTKENSEDIIQWPAVIKHMENIKPFVLSIISKLEFVDLISQINNDS